MVPMDGGIINNKENYTEKVLLPDQSLEKNNFSTLTDSKNVCQNIMPHSIKDIAQEGTSEAICQSILFDILDQIEMLPSRPYHEFGIDNQIFNDKPDIHLMQVEEIVVQKISPMWDEIDEDVKESIIDQVPSIPENIVQDDEQFLPA